MRNTNFAFLDDPTADFDESNDVSTAAQLTDIVELKAAPAADHKKQFLKVIEDVYAKVINDDTISNHVNLRATTARQDVGIQSAPALLQAEWSGCVTGVDENEYFFTASLKGVKGVGVKDEEDDAIIPISDVSESDKELLLPGNFFRLCAMYEVSPSGQPRRYTQVIFRRLPAYRQQDLDEALERGRQLGRGLRVE